MGFRPLGNWGLSHEAGLLCARAGMRGLGIRALL